NSLRKFKNQGREGVNVTLLSSCPSLFCRNIITGKKQKLIEAVSQSPHQHFQSFLLDLRLYQSSFFF
ncbi:MAG: hypothetical protein ACNYVW_07575, partial [Methanosarcinales archaeon]